MIKCIIIEDQLPAQRILQKFIASHELLSLSAIFTNLNNVDSFLKENNVDLIFLDIHLPSHSGLELMKGKESLPDVILTTAFTEYAIEGFELNVKDYLVKPFSYERFCKSIDRIVQSKSQHKGILFVKTGYEFQKVFIHKLEYIHSDLDYTEIHFDGQKILSNETLSSWEAQLSDKGVVRVHKSFLVNLSHIDVIKGNKVHLMSHRLIPIGRAYKESLMKSINNYK